MPSLEAFERDLAAATGTPMPTPIAAPVPPEVARLAARGKAEGQLTKTLFDPAPYGASAPPSPAAEPAGVPGGGLGKTLFLGGTQAPEAVHQAPTALEPPLTRAAAEPPGEPKPEAPDPRRPDASPLSRSVLAPQSWMPPPPGSVVPAPVLAAAPEAPPEPAPAAAVPPVAPPAAAAAPSSNAARTMLGMPAFPLPGARAAAGAPAAAPPPADAAPPAQAQPQQPVFGSASKTMLGVAIPGIAPTGAATSNPSAAPAAPTGPAALPSRQGTLLGVAIPGIAPSGPAAPAANAPGAPLPKAYGSGMPTAYGLGAVAPMAPPPPIVPAPPPLQEEPIPAAPARPKKRGVPAVAVVAIVMGLVAIGGTAIILTMRGAPPLSAQPQLDDTGRESLKLTCASCPDGTTVKLGASTTTMKGSSAVLPLPAPLSIGDNTLAVAIDRPGTGRDEDVKIHVPVAYRVRADLTTLTATPPAVTVRVEALPGTDVRVEGKPLALDPTGKGAYALDVTPDVEGPSDETKTIERKIPFAITPKDGKPETGELLARVAVTPLHIDSPGLVLYTDRANAPLAGQTKAGATVTVDGTPATVDAQGRFGVRAELPATGERTFKLVVAAPPLAPRTAHVRVVRVASLEGAAKELEAKSPIPFGVFSKDPAGNVGKDGVVEGEVVRASVDATHCVLLVDDKKTCPAGSPCLVRILHGEEVKVAPGDTVRAFGRVDGAITAGGQTVPELDASLVIVVPRGARR